MATKYGQWKQRDWKARVPAYFKGFLIDASPRKVARSASGEVGRYSFFNPSFELGRNVGQHIDADVYEELEKILDELVSRMASNLIMSEASDARISTRIMKLARRTYSREF
jgi:hypothetical protein